MPASMFSLALFGPFEARYSNLPLSSFATDKIRALFAYLAIESGKPHRRETLATLLWPNYPDNVALRNLRQSLYRLRKTLEQVDPLLPDQLLSQARLTVTFHAEQISLDVARFNDAIRASRRADDPIPHLSRIPSLYRGDLLEGLSVSDAYAFNEWLRIQREVFHQQAVEALARLLALYEAVDDDDAILQTAPKLLMLEPWHEETHRRLMQTHIHLGNRPRAIAQYQELETILMEELGADPSPATTALYRQIRTNTTPDEPPGPARSRGAEIPAPARTRQRIRLPIPIAPLVGRQKELSYLIRTLQDPACRLMTVTGPGGIGKTRLCIETARRVAADPDRFPHGSIFISLAQIEQGDQLASTVAQAAGLALQARMDPLQELIRHFHHQDLLLILDNYEHLLAKTGDGTLPPAIRFVVDLLSAVPGVVILATSRDPLGIQPEWVYPLDGLPYQQKTAVDQAVLLEEAAPQLFIQNARRVNASFDPAAHADAILDICRLTDGLPLAIEMAATWLRVYTCQEIARSISDSLDFLVSPFQDVPARQRSIRAILNSTWEQLNAPQQATLMALSVFRGGFHIQAALSVAEANIFDLSILIDKSLLRRTNDNRYFLHELVGQFAREKLEGSGRAHGVQDRHARYYLEDLAEKTVAFNGPNPVEAISHIRLDQDNLRTAWNWAASQANLTLLEMGMQGLAQFWVMTGANIEGEASILKAISAVENLPEEPRAASVLSFLASSLAWLQIGIGKNEDAEKNILAALALAGKSHRADRRAVALSLQGWLLQNQGQLDEAEEVLNEARAIFEANGSLLELSLALIRIGSVYWWRNMLDKSLEFYERSLKIEQQIGNKRGVNRAFGGLGMAYMHLEKFEQAVAYMDKALQLDRELGNVPGMIRNLGHLGNISLRKGNYDSAAVYYLEALEIEQKTGSRNTASIWFSNLGRIYTRLNDHRQALEYYEQSVYFANETGSRHQLCEALLGKASLFLRQDRLEEARTLIEEGLTISYEIDRKDTKLRGMILKARWLAKTGDPQNARLLLESSRETLASEYKETETLARLHYELWKIDGREADARVAVALYEDCQARAEQIEYTERLRELAAFLDEQADPEQP